MVGIGAAQDACATVGLLFTPSQIHAVTLSLSVSLTIRRLSQELIVLSQLSFEVCCQLATQLLRHMRQEASHPDVNLPAIWNEVDLG